jgi:hypothetical protein
MTEAGTPLTIKRFAGTRLDDPAAFSHKSLSS